MTKLITKIRHIPIDKPCLNQAIALINRRKAAENARDFIISIIILSKIKTHTNDSRLYPLLTLRTCRVPFV